MVPFSFWGILGPNPFSIISITGGVVNTNGGIDTETWYVNPAFDSLAVNWGDSSNEDSYTIVVYQSDGTTIYCPQAAIAQNVVTKTFDTLADCGALLIEGNEYIVSVEAIQGALTRKASNAPYSITVDTVDPVVSITGGPTQPTTTSTTANFTFTNSDATSGVASIECFIDNVSQGACTSPANYTSLADGDREFKVVVTDYAGNSSEDVYAWNINTLAISGPQVFYGQVGTAWSNIFTVTGGTGAANITYSLPVMPATATVTGDASYAPNVGYTPAAGQRYDFTLRATDTVSGNTKDYTFTVDAVATGVCLWIGPTSTTWATTTNWTFCGGVAPISTSKIAIWESAPFMPIVSANTTVDSFGLGTGGGTVTVNNGIYLYITAATNSFRSSVKFQGATTTCTACRVRGNPGGLQITDNATVTLLKGIELSMGSSVKDISVGNGTTGGTLATGPAGAANEWPTINIYGTASGQILANGASGSPAILRLDGIKFSGNPTASNTINLQDWYHIQQMDNIYTSNASTTKATFIFTSCTNAVITDVAWTSLEFVNAVTPTGYNVRADGTNCSTLPTITISHPVGSSGGAGYGSAYELDPNNKINWTDDSTLTCTWNGSVSTVWENAGNWSTCANGRGGYPDQLDYVIIPSAPINQPVVSVNTTIKGFALSGSGGGTITVNAAITLFIVDQTSSFRSDIKLKGATTTCTNCKVEGLGELQITDNATLTLLTGIKVLLGSSVQSFYVGNGVTGGTLATGPAGATNTWPTLSGYAKSNIGFIVVNGASGQLAKLNIDGLKVAGVQYVSYGSGLYLQDWYEVVKLDNIEMTGYQTNNYPSSGNAYIRLASCTNATITDTSWSGMFFSIPVITGLGYNVRADGTNCSTLPAITMDNQTATSGGMGYGSDYELDPNNKINWLNSTTFTCTWTGAANTAWENSANWSGCANGRGGYPDQMDTPVIPVTGNQPVVSTLSAVKGFGVGTGGGTITVNSNITLSVMKNSSSVRSDVKVQGATTTCTNCKVLTMGSMAITDGASLTLLKGLTLTGAFNGTYINVGDGITAGTLATGPAGATNEWPTIDMFGATTYQILVTGVSGAARSKINFDGIHLKNTQHNARENIEFVDWYEVVKLDNVSFTSYSTNYPASGHAFLRFDSCTNALMTDTTWNGLNFVSPPSVSGYNIRIDGTNCNSTYIPDIFLSNYTGTGQGASKELDPSNKVYWLLQPPLQSLYEGSNGVLWTKTFPAAGGTGPYSYTLPTNPGGATVDGAGLVSFTPATAGAHNFVLRVTDTIGGEFEDFAFTFYAYETGLCLWTGLTSTTWETASNWSFCAGAAPLATSKIAISATAPNMPTIAAANVTVDSFGLGPGGGTLTVNAARALTLTNATGAIRSSVKLQGNTTTCTSCIVAMNTSTPMYMTDGAVVTLGKGLLLNSGSGQQQFYLGNGTTGATLIAQGGSVEAEKPRISSGTSNSFNYFYVNGGAGSPSKLNLDGIAFAARSNASGATIRLVANYTIERFDNVTFKNWTNPFNGKAHLEFDSCTGATVTDTAWQNISFEPVMDPTAKNIIATHASCSGLPIINLSNSLGTHGPGYGSLYETDTYNVFNWSDDASQDCTWTGLVSTVWEDAGNWSSCTNGKGNYPSATDFVVIPAAPVNQPVITQHTPIQGFASGAGGGIVTINNGMNLYLLASADQIKSSVRFQGNSTTCITCWVNSNSRHMDIVENAVVTLLSGVTLITDSDTQDIRVGNGLTGGTLRAIGGLTEAEKPRIGSQLNNSSGTRSLRLNGASGSPAIIDFDGAVIGMRYSNSNHLDFINYYEVVKFDKVSFQGSTAGAGAAPYINFADCTNATITDTSWIDISFSGATQKNRKNIIASHASCSSLPVITLTNLAGDSGGQAYGSVWEDDPYNRITWSNNTPYTCTWTGTSNTAWANSGNWSGCANSRGGYPGGMDHAIVPVTANQPVVSTNTAILGFTVGAGGGTITINAGQTLSLLDDSGAIKSDIKFQGATVTCTNCIVSSQQRDFNILENASMTLLKGIMAEVGSASRVNIGDGATGGTLIAEGGVTAAEKPGLGTSTSSGTPTLITANGAAGNPVVLDIDGLRIRGRASGGYVNLRLQAYVVINQFDNVAMEVAFAAQFTGAALMIFEDCATTTITDTTWNSFSQVNPITTGYNLSAPAAACAGLPKISLTNYSGSGVCGAVGAGACALEDDPQNRFDWD